MKRFPFRLALLAAIVAAPASAQELLPPLPPAPPEPTVVPDRAQAEQPSRVFCHQTVTYDLSGGQSAPPQYQPFMGIWSDAAWDSRTCAALIVEKIDPDGTAKITYVYGPLSAQTRVAAAILHGTGIVQDGALAFQNSDGTQYTFRPAVGDLAGRLTTPQGQTYEARFKKTY